MFTFKQRESTLVDEGFREFILGRDELNELSPSAYDMLFREDGSPRLRPSTGALRMQGKVENAHLRIITDHQRINVKSDLTAVELEARDGGWTAMSCKLSSPKVAGGALLILPKGATVRCEIDGHSPWMSVKQGSNGEVKLHGMQKRTLKAKTARRGRLPKTATLGRPRKPKPEIAAPAMN